MVGFLIRVLKVIGTVAVLAFIYFLIQAAFIYYSLNTPNSTAQACWSANVGETCDLTVPNQFPSVEVAEIGGEYWKSLWSGKSLYRVTLRDVSTGEERTTILYYFKTGDDQVRVLRYQ